MKKYITPTAIILLIVVFPAASWFYLKNGLQYRKTALSELKQLGRIDDFNLTNQLGLSVNKENLKGKIMIVGMVNTADNHSDTICKEISKLHKQFDDRNDVVFLMPTSNPSHDSINVLRNYGWQFGIKDSTQCLFLDGDSIRLNALEKSLLLPDYQNKYLTLCDSNGIIRKHYNVYKGSEMQRLIEHVAMLLPLPKEEKIERKIPIK